MDRCTGTLSRGSSITLEPQASSSGWDDFSRRLRTRVNQSAFKTWLEPLTPNIDGTTLRLEAPTDFHRRWVRDRFMPAIHDAGVETFGPDMTVVLEVPAVPRDVAAAWQSRPAARWLRCGATPRSGAA